MPKRLPPDHLTEAEWAIAQRRVGTIKQLQTLVLTHQEALKDILGLALEARQLSPDTHEINLAMGTIVKKSE